jgi:hypothetical protein
VELLQVAIFAQLNVEVLVESIKVFLQDFFAQDGSFQRVCRVVVYIGE